MNKEEVLETLKDIVRVRLSVNGEILTDVTLDNLGIDSLDFYDLLVNAEVAFGITIPDESVRDFSVSDNTLSNLADILCSL